MATSRNQKDYTLYEGSEDWSALYEDGKLIEVGDHYWVQEKLLQLLGIEVVQSDDFIRGGSAREDVAPSLVAIEDWLADANVEEAEATLAAARDAASTAADRLKEAEEQVERARSLKSMQDRYGTW